LDLTGVGFFPLVLVGILEVYLRTDGQGWQGVKFFKDYDLLLFVFFFSLLVVTAREAIAGLGVSSVPK
tara:strand:- start:32063 stop:32266 length:204 start_codon:yes stop_codon:yes gene_type:complete